MDSAEISPMPDAPMPDASMPDASTVLELLAGEASTARFEQLLRDAGSRPAGAAQMRELDRCVRLALDVRLAADQRRRRESDLVALIDAVPDAVLQESTQDLLEVIANQTRRLLDFDMAYVSLRQPDGGSIVHRSYGQTTALTVGLRLTPGRGLGDLAQEREAPFWTPDYLTDAQFPHSPQIDEAVRAEGLHAIAAVPMMHGGRAVGVLYGACRVIRHFTADELSLLQSLAAVCASQIEATRRREASVAALAEAEARAELADRRADRARALADLHTRLIGLALEGAGLTEVLKAAALALGADLTVQDSAGRVVASAGEPLEFPSGAATRAMLAAHAAEAPIALSDSAWAVPLTAGAAQPFVLLYRAQPPSGEVEQQALRAIDQAVAVSLTGAAATIVPGPERDECLDDLLSATSRTARRLAERLRRLGLDPAQEHVVLAVRLEPAHRRQAAVWAAAQSYRHHGLKTVRDDYLVLLLPAGDASATARRVCDELTQVLGGPVTVGAAGPGTGPGAVAGLYQEARRCLETLVALGGTGGAATAGDLGFLGLLLSDSQDITTFVTATLGPLLDYDARRAAALTTTLEAYFAAGGSPTHAAQALHVHTNTVTRRLDRITELLGADWQQPAKALELQLALRLHRARAAVHRREPPRSGS